MSTKKSTEAVPLTALAPMPEEGDTAAVTKEKYLQALNSDNAWKVAWMTTIGVIWGELGVFSPSGITMEHVAELVGEFNRIFDDVEGYEFCMRVYCCDVDAAMIATIKCYKNAIGDLVSVNKECFKTKQEGVVDTLVAMIDGMTERTKKIQSRYLEENKTQEEGLLRQGLSGWANKQSDLVNNAIDSLSKVAECARESIDGDERGLTGNKSDELKREILSALDTLRDVVQTVLKPLVLPLSSIFAGEEAEQESASRDLLAIGNDLKGIGMDFENSIKQILSADFDSLDGEILDNARKSLEDQVQKLYYNISNLFCYRIEEFRKTRYATAAQVSGKGDDDGFWSSFDDAKSDGAKIQGFSKDHFVMLASTLKCFLFPKEFMAEMGFNAPPSLNIMIRPDCNSHVKFGIGQEFTWYITPTDVTMYLPAPPVGKSSAFGALALADYNATGVTYPFTAC